MVAAHDVEREFTGALGIGFIRSVARDEIERYLKSPDAATPQSALLFVDLDQFKQVNDTLGHPCGDRLLCEVTDRLREMLRPVDFVARFGGDEFVVFQRGITSQDDAAALARRIVDRLSEQYAIDNHMIEIGASIGIAIATPGVSADILIKNKNLRILVEGHTDDVGGPEVNKKLSQDRADAVRDYLTSRGIGANRFRTVSYGEERPKHDNAREETRRLNRRAALVVRLQK